MDFVFDLDIYLLIKIIVQCDDIEFIKFFKLNKFLYNIFSNKLTENEKANYGNLTNHLYSLRMEKRFPRYYDREDRTVSCKETYWTIYEIISDKNPDVNAIYACCRDNSLFDLIIYEKEFNVLPTRYGAYLAVLNGNYDIVVWLEKRNVLPEHHRLQDAKGIFREFVNEVQNNEIFSEKKKLEFKRTYNWLQKRYPYFNI